MKYSVHSILTIHKNVSETNLAHQDLSHGFTLVIFIITPVWILSPHHSSISRNSIQLVGCLIISGLSSSDIWGAPAIGRSFWLINSVSARSNFTQDESIMRPNTIYVIYIRK